MAKGADETVSAAQLARNFSQYRERALTAPVFISSYGRKTHVLVSVEEFERRQRATEPDAETYLAVAADLGEWTTGGLIICDDASRIRYINRIACGTLGIGRERAIGVAMADAIPNYAGSLMEAQAKRTINASYPASADVPSPVRENAWLRFWSYPWYGWNVLSFRDITEHIESHRLAEVKEAILEGMSVHGEIGYARLSVRGTIERVDKPLCDMIGLPESRLGGNALLDMVVAKARIEFRDALETVLGRGSPVSCTTTLLNNNAQEIRVRCGMVPLKGAFGLEGAVVLFTPDN